MFVQENIILLGQEISKIVEKNMESIGKNFELSKDKFKEIDTTEVRNKPIFNPFSP